MSMLSEQRRKTKWVVNPTKKPLWSTDSSGIKFGKELMEKMGWSAGKGLGLNEQGIQEPLRVSFKNDTKGMGFKGNDDNWIEHQDEFNSLLNQLRSGEDSSAVKDQEQKKREIKSLEEKSKTSKARVHYQKFTRGKDLSKYSENDLACIIGTNKMKKEKPKSEEIIKTESKTDGNCETSFGVTTINSGSLQDYFKRKWIINKNKSDKSNTDSIENSTEIIPNGKSSTCNGQSEGQNEEKKSKKKKHKSTSEEQFPMEGKISQTDILECNDKVEKRKRKKKENEVSSDNEPTKKKKKKNSDRNCAVEREISQENDSILPECSDLTFENQHLDSFPKKGKKEKNFLKAETADDEDESSCVKEKKKRKKTEKNLDETSILDTGLSEEIYATNGLDECKSSKKKKKKEKIQENEIETAQSCSNEDDPSLAQNDSLQEASTKSKKIKKSKKENSGETEMKSISTDLEEYSQPDETSGKFNIEIENENTSSKKKKKKKDKKEKSTEEAFNCSNHEKKKSLAVGVETTVDVESGKKKKKKKGKLEENNCSNENEESISNNISEEPEKKKKDKKEKCSLHGNEENQTIPEGESVKKKKENSQKGNESQQPCQIEPELGKSGTEKVPKGIDSTKIEDNPVNGTKTEGEKRIEKLRVNLFGDGASVKYFPEKGPNERVLKLIKWANISEFRGSNLRDVEGYGRKLMYERQTR